MLVVTFDLWHTLMFLPPEDEEAYMRGQVEIARDLLTAAPVILGRSVLPSSELSRIFAEVYADAVRRAGEGASVTPAAQFARAAALSGREPDVPAYLDRLRREVEQTSLRRAPGAIEMLRSLRADGYRVAVISNTVGEPGAFLRPALTAMGFDEYVERYVFSDELPWTKPAPEIFLHAVRALGGSAQEAVHVGDGWSDLEGARRAGFRAGILYHGLQEYGPSYRSLFVSTASTPSEAAYRVARLDEVVPLVRRILPMRRQ